MYAHAASQATCVAQSFLGVINENVLYPLIVFLIALALLLFLYGGFKFILGANNPASREQGRKHMIYGVIGLLVMVSAWTILTIAANSILPGLPDTECSGWRGDGVTGGGR